MTSTTCPRNLPQHFNGCTCTSAPGAVTAEATDIDLVTPAATEPKRHVWSTDPNKVKPPKAAVALVADAEDAEMDVEVIHDSHNVTVSVSRGDNNISVVWTKGDYYDEPDRGKLPFRTGGTATKGVRFNYANAHIRGQYPVVRSARQARMWIGLHETPTAR